MSNDASTVTQKSWSATQVYNVCDKMQIIERVRAQDRALINQQFNGGRPYSKEEVEKYQIQINVNWGEGKHLLMPAINQLNNALIFKERFFTGISKNSPTEKKQDDGEIFTSNIHECLKNGMSGMRWMFMLMSRNASLALHGIGPLLWANGFRARPRYVPLEDLLIPTDTLCDFSNLMFFAVNLYLTAGEFFDMTHADGADATGWDIKACREIVNDLVFTGQQQTSQFDYLDEPEKWVEWLKQNRVMWDLDSTSTAKLRMFFYKDPKTKKWYRCMMMKEGTKNVPAKNTFIYDGRDKVFADSISQILHVQYGDNSIVAPLKYHSVRGLGVDLYSPVEANNRLRCEFVQHVLFNLKTLLRIDNPTDRDRPKVLDLSQYSVIEEAIKFVPAAERYQVDAPLVEQAMSQMKQIMGEGSQSYVKDVESGTNQPRTATETNVLENQASEAVSNMLQRVYAIEEFMWQETVRRFCDPLSEDDEVKEFRQKCIDDGIAESLMEAKNWGVKIERVLGGGNQYLAVQEATALLAQMQRFDPNTQRIILRKWVITITRDPKMGDLLVPADPHQATPGVIAAEDVYATLMLGIPASVREGIDRGPYVESLIGMMGKSIQQVQQMGGVGTPQEVLGLQTVGQHIAQNIQILAQDKEKKSQVKLYGDELGKLMNLVKAFAERQQQAMGKGVKESVSINYKDAPEDIKRQMEMQAGFQPSQLPVTDPKMLKAQQGMQIKDAQFKQRSVHDHIAFLLDQARENARTDAEMSRQDVQKHQELANKNLEAAMTLFMSLQQQQHEQQNAPEKNGETVEK